MKKIIEQKKSIIPSCDVSTLAGLKKIVNATKGIEKISAYKVGFELALRFGLKDTVMAIKKLSDKPVLYDHQKGGNDIPEMGERFAASCAETGVDAVILFPFTGPKSEVEWIKAAQKQGLGVIVGAEMTHEKFLFSEGGFIEDEAVKKIFEVAAKNGVQDFVVPANKPQRISEHREFLEGLGIKPVFFSPGISAQGGKVEEAVRAAGGNLHAIVGRALYRSKDIRETAKKLCDLL